MLRKMMYRKIVVVSSILIVMLMLYLIPANNDKVKVTEKLEYVYPNDMEVVYLLDDYNNLSRVNMSVFGDGTLDKAKNLFAYCYRLLKDNIQVNTSYNNNYSYANNTYSNGLTPRGYSSFNNFKAREYDYKALERKLLGWD